MTCILSLSHLSALPNGSILQEVVRLCARISVCPVCCIAWFEVIVLAFCLVYSLIRFSLVETLCATGELSQMSFYVRKDSEQQRCAYVM